MRNILLTLLACAGAFAAHAQAAEGPARNPYLAADKYATSHFDPARTESVPYPAPRGSFRGELRRMPRVAGGPVNWMELASTSPRYMWGTFTGGVRYIDVSGNGLRTVARLATPGAQWLEPATLDQALAQRWSGADEVTALVRQTLRVSAERLDTNVHALVDQDNVLYSSAPDGMIHAYGLAEPADPIAGIRILRSLDFGSELRRLTAGAGAGSRQQPVGIVGLGVTYDGKLVILSSRSVTVMDRSLRGDRVVVELGPDERVTTGMAIDEKGGIYVASDTTLRKLVWTGAKLSADEQDGAWAALYDTGHTPPNGKAGRGTGTAPVLMGFDGFPDKLVVIVDGADRMKAVAFWRDGIPAGFEQKPGTRSRRVAGQIELTCGLAPAPDFVQTAQPLVASGYGLFVLNSVRTQGTDDRLVDALANGPVFAPAMGAERIEWDPSAHEWRSVWTRADLAGTSMAPALSTGANAVFVNGYTSTDGWELTGLDWDTGKTVHRTIFGYDNLGNAAFAPLQFLPNGDLLFNSIGGPVRVRYPGPAKP